MEQERPDVTGFDNFAGEINKRIAEATADIPAVVAVSAYAQLAPTKKTFVDHYIAEGHAARAYLLTWPHYKDKPASALRVRVWELAHEPMVQAAIAERQREIAAKIAITPERVLQEIAKIAFFNRSKIMRVAADGTPYYDFSEITEDDWAAISTVSVKEFKEGRGDDARDAIEIKIGEHSKTDALEKLAKYFGMYAPEKHDHTLNGSVTTKNTNFNVNMTVEDAAAAYAASLEED
jgi:phage terminase small subunit